MARHVLGKVWGGGKAHPKMSETVLFYGRRGITAATTVWLLPSDRRDAMPLLPMYRGDIRIRDLVLYISTWYL